MNLSTTGSNSNGTLDWDQMGPAWPHHSHSEFIKIDAMTWHVQVLGPAHGPEVLLVHGTGASTHSWAEVAANLATRYRVVMMDLPGHGFSTSTSGVGSSLPGMAAGIGNLVRKLDLHPKLVVGHSAGAAILARMCLDDVLAPQALVSFNGAFLPFNGVAGKLFSQVAKVFSSTELVPWIVSRQAREGKAVQRLIDQTGSEIPPQSVACYQKLLRAQAHVSAALRMMANWDLQPLYEDLRGLNVPLHLVACTRDATVPVDQARQLHSLTMNSFLHELEGLGHLGHEERPDLHCTLLEQIIESPDNPFFKESTMEKL